MLNISESLWSPSLSRLQIIIIIIIIFLEKILFTAKLTIKIVFTIISLEKKKTYPFETLFKIPVDLKST